MGKMKIKISGLTPHLQHNNQAADPLNIYKKAMTPITSKTKKTDADFLLLSRIEWEAGLYFDDEGHIAIPAENFETMLWTAGKKNRNGPKFKEGVMIEENFVRLIEFGNENFRLKNKPERSEDLPTAELDPLFTKYYDRRLAKPPGSKGTVVRTRPRFDKWAYIFTIMYDEEQIDKRTIMETLEVAGTRIGFSDYRPRYGKFEYEILEES